MPIFIDNKEEDTLHPTLFGFSTQNGFAAKSLNFVYVVVMIVAMCFAFHALNLILPDWNSGVLFLAALAVVGLPYCIKIIMYGKPVFEYKYAVLCIIISLLPTIFDFVGFYSETSIREALLKTKFEVIETVNYFDKDARSAITKRILALEQEQSKLVAEFETRYNKLQKELQGSVVDAEQMYIDETKGIPGRTTSGTAGVGPKAKELEANLRKTQANVELQKKELDNNKNKEQEKLEKDYQSKLQSYQEGITAIDSLVKADRNGNGLIFEVNKANSFNELADVAVKLNSGINIVSSKLNVEPKYVKFETDNVIQLSFSALLSGEITALICFALALLLEVVDTIIVYMVRGVKTVKKKTDKDIPESKVRESKSFGSELGNKMLEKVNSLKLNIF